MKPLPTNQIFLAGMCILPADENASKREKILNIASTVALIVVELCIFISSGAFIMKNVSTDLEVSLYGVFQVVASFGLTYMMISGIIFRHKIAAMIQTLSNFYDESENEDSHRFLAWANGKSEWLWKKYIKFGMKGYVVSTAISVTIPLSICLINGDFDTKQLYHMYRTVLPWNSQTPFGYFFELCYHLMMAEAYLFINGAFMLLFVSLSLHHRAFYETFRYKLRDFDGNENIKVFLRGLIRYHISVDDFFVESANVYSPFVMIQLICWMLMMACSVFQLDLLLKHFGPDINLLLASIMVAASTLFVYCYFGKLATDNFTKMGDCLYENNWYEIPVESQKYFILMIQKMQKPRYYHGFGVAVLDLQTFTHFLKAVYTYYMMFKTITTN